MTDYNKLAECGAKLHKLIVEMKEVSQNSDTTEMLEKNLHDLCYTPPEDVPRRINVLAQDLEREFSVQMHFDEGSWQEEFQKVWVNGMDKIIPELQEALR